MCHSVPVFVRARLIYDSIQCVTGTQPNDQPARRLNAPKHIFFMSKMFFNAKVHYEQTLSSAIHHTSNVSLLQENITPCCNLPKQSTFPLLLLRLQYLNLQTMMKYMYV